MRVEGAGLRMRVQGYLSVKRVSTATPSLGNASNVPPRGGLATRTVTSALL